MNEVKDDTETLLRWQSVGGGALPFNARAKRTRTCESPTCTKKIANMVFRTLLKSVFEMFNRGVWLGV